MKSVRHGPGNFTLNCNFQINYWAAESGNLAECHEPMLDFIRQLSANSQRIARELYGARGWVAHHNADIWARGGPTKGLGCEAIFQVGSAWLCQHLWEHYAFSGDPKDLRDAWPAAERRRPNSIWTPWSKTRKPHRLVTCPDHFLRAGIPPAGWQDCRALCRADRQHDDDPPAF